MLDFRDLLLALLQAEARIVVIGGVALQMQGSAYMTADLDIAYERSRENAMRIAIALAPFAPRMRGFPVGLPFSFDAQALLSTEILTLSTTAGDIDLLGEVIGLGSFTNVLKAADVATLDGYTVRVLSIDGLIRTKRAAGRPKDVAGLHELEALREARTIAAPSTED